MSGLRLLTAITVAGMFAGLVTGTASPRERKPPRQFDERVLVKDNFFSPRSLTIEPGETVKWSWRGDNRHNVTFTKVPKGAKRRSSRTKRNGGWLRSFHKQGQYRYVCTRFAGMRGLVTVKAPAAQGTDAAATPPSPAQPR
jgi:plastocyanin